MVCRPVIVLGHSFGSAVALEFIRNAPLQWRGSFVKHLITVAPTWSGGGHVGSLMAFASGPLGLLFVQAAPKLAMRSMWTVEDLRDCHSQPTVPGGVWEPAAGDN